MGTELERRVTLGSVTGTPRGKRPLGRPWRRWEDNTRIRMNPQANYVNARNWIDFAEDTDYWRGLVNMALNL